MVGLLCAAIVISGTALYLTYRQPEVCSLCGSGNRERYQAPVILNLTTGQSNEIRIYDPNFPFSKYEIAPFRPPESLALHYALAIPGGAIPAPTPVP